EVLERCFHEGNLLVRATGDVIALSPPLIVEPDQIGEMFEILGRVLRQVA
ncbi:MAG: aspartate aminotransferase family protein, partial [Gammaproteobacteria bacterium]